MAIENEPILQQAHNTHQQARPFWNLTTGFFFSVEHLVFPVALAKATLKKPADPREIQRAVGK